MNDDLGALKARLRQVEGILAQGSGLAMGDRIGVAQAVSQARRLVRRADRTRPPTAELRASIEQAETLAGASH